MLHDFSRGRLESPDEVGISFHLIAPTKDAGVPASWEHLRAKALCAIGFALASHSWLPWALRVVQFARVESI